MSPSDVERYAWDVQQSHSTAATSSARVPLWNRSCCARVHLVNLRWFSGRTQICCGLHTPVQKNSKPANIVELGVCAPTHRRLFSITVYQSPPLFLGLLFAFSPCPHLSLPLGIAFEGILISYVISHLYS